MIDLPQDTPPAHEQAIGRALQQCGLREGGFTVRHVPEFQGIAIVIEADAGATPAQFDCIRQAAGSEIVTFSQNDLHHAYTEHVYQAMRPQMLAHARAALEEHGALEGFPERKNFDSDRVFAEAIERHCGADPGSFFAVSPFGLTVRPDGLLMDNFNDKRVLCLMAAINYVNASDQGITFGFIGNEAVRPDE